MPGPYVMERTMKENEHRLKPTVFVEAVPELAMLRGRFLRTDLAGEAGELRHRNTVWTEQTGLAARDERRE
jgi:hypothetical protein